MTSAHFQKPTPPLPEEDYPYLWRVLRDRGLTFLAMYTTEEVAAIFEAAPRTIEEWFQSGRIQSRSLPKRKRCLAIDLENFFRGSGEIADSNRANQIDCKPGGGEE